MLTKRGASSLTIVVDHGSVGIEDKQCSDDGNISDPACDVKCSVAFAVLIILTPHIKG